MYINYGVCNLNFLKKISKTFSKEIPLAHQESDEQNPPARLKNLLVLIIRQDFLCML